MRAELHMENCRTGFEERLHAYLDGELSFRDQSSLFAHLADCAHCRQTMESVLVFRRIAREEYLAVPPATDEVFFSRLDRLRAQRRRLDRAYERAPMWRPHRRVSFGAVLLVAVAVFLLGVMMPRPSSTATAVGEEDRIRFDEPVGLTVYVIYPGLTVEAVRVEQTVPLESW